MSGPAGMLQGAAAGVEGVRLKFPGSPRLLFEDVSFRVNSGEKVLLLGPSGCGKSTLLQVLSGIIPHSLEIPVKYDDIVIPASWGYLFQDPETQFCMPYVDEELAFVLENRCVDRSQMLPRMTACLEQVGLKLEAMHVPIASLSQGMKQRLAMASLLLLEPDVWFLDEPTALLDPEGTREVWQTLKEVTAGKTVIIVEHKIDEIVDFVDRVVLFDAEGGVIADGSPREIFVRCLPQLKEYGIWYPDVWRDYARHKLADRSSRSVPGAGGGSSRSEAEPLIQLDRFAVQRGGISKLKLEHAAIAPGDWIAVVGPNGAGKSTLLLGLMQLTPTKGGYKLLGRDIRRFEDVASHAAYVFQNPEMQFITNTVYDEIAFGFRRDGEPEAEVRRRTEELLELFGLAAQRSQHPYQLSLGQKRRLSVAAATVKEQAVMLLDEPTFGQDAVNTFALLERLEQWRQGGTAIVMVTHDPEIVRYFATKVWAVRDGRLEAELLPEQYIAEWEKTDVHLRESGCGKAMEVELR